LKIQIDREKERGCDTFGAIGSGSHLIGKWKKIGGKFSKTFVFWLLPKKQKKRVLFRGNEACLGRRILLRRTTPFAGLKRFVLGHSFPLN
jgi:hypothetical protein